MIKFAEFCSGIGGFRLGLENIGWESVYSNEIDDKCELTYMENFHTKFDSKDIFQIDISQIPDFNVLCAGFPCQPFSQAGNQQGFLDARGTIYFEIEKIIEIKQPEVVFLENVKNLVRHDKGNTFRYICASLEKIGYTVYYEILNSAYFSVPQSRERVYIVAFRQDLNIELFNFTSYLTEPVGLRKFINHNDYSIPITTRWEEYIDLYTKQVKESDISFKVPKTRKKLEKIGKETDLSDCVFQIRSSGIRAISLDQPFPTFAVSNSGGGAMIPVLSQERRHLNLIEMKRIMGFPDNFIFPVSRTDSIKQLANAVVPQVIESIGKDIQSVLLW